ncbi:MAG: (d)CMP kinase [Clostridia bacterium]|nr:(d)CMP kinase [Clostridia bacterium]
MSFIVAIDGPAGSGKGTVAKLVGEKLGLVNIDTGAMFRCVALKMLQDNIALDDEENIKKILDSINIELKNDNGNLIILLDGNDVSLKIRTEEVSKFVSPVSTNPMVRRNLLNLQRKVSEGKNIIMEGRDIGTVVFPNADVKIYLEATAEERAKRRVLQNQEKGLKVDYDEVLREIKIRDERDSTREIAPLKKADDAILIDSTNMTIEEVVKCISNIIKEKKNT